MTTKVAILSVIYLLFNSVILVVCLVVDIVAEIDKWYIRTHKYNGSTIGKDKCMTFVIFITYSIFLDFSQECSYLVEILPGKCGWRQWQLEWLQRSDYPEIFFAAVGIRETNILHKNACKLTVYTSIRFTFRSTLSGLISTETRRE